MNRISTLTNALSVFLGSNAQDELQRRFHQAVSALPPVSQAIKLANIIQYSNDAEDEEVCRLLGTLLDSSGHQGFVYSMSGGSLPLQFHAALNWSPRTRQGGLNSATMLQRTLATRTNFSNIWKRTKKTFTTLVKSKYASRPPLSICNRGNAASEHGWDTEEHLCIGAQRVEADQADHEC
jgi:hypothetical protein